MLFGGVFVGSGDGIVIFASGARNRGAGVARWAASWRANSLSWELPVWVSAGVYEVTVGVCQYSKEGRHVRWDNGRCYYL